MSQQQHTGISSIRKNALTASLLVTLMSAGAAVLLGAPPAAALVAAIGSLAGSILCIRFFDRALEEVIQEQERIISGIPGLTERSVLPAGVDGLDAVTSRFRMVVEACELRLKEQRKVLDRFAGITGDLYSSLGRSMAGDDRQTLEVKGILKGMQGLNDAFVAVIAEIEDLSRRSEERASISSEMSATTDAIADNINQYSAFVLETSSSIEEMARAILETGENIRDLSASTEQTVASISLISTSQATVKENAERGANASQNVRMQAQNGLRNMAATLKAMQEIVKSNDESFESISRLSRFSARVGEILNVIQEVVEQTKLLSLNASIIAAQAGERGKAFAVVAEEVRSLAHRTSASTKEIEELVRNIQKETAGVQRTIAIGKDKVKEGVKISTMANDALARILQSAEEASEVVTGIATETTEQSSGIQRIAEAAEINLQLVQQLTDSTEHQQQGTTLIVNNLEQMRELAHRINSSAQEQVKANKIYLMSVMEDNDRTKALKDEAACQAGIAGAAVDSLRSLESLVTSTVNVTRQVADAVNEMRVLTAQQHEESAVFTAE